MLFKEDFTKDLKDLVFSEKQSKKSLETKLGMLLNKYSKLIKKCSEDFLDYEEYKYALKFQKKGFARLYDLNTSKYVYLSKDSIHCMQTESSVEINRRCTIILKSGQEIVINQLIRAMELFLF